MQLLDEYLLSLRQVLAAAQSYEEFRADPRTFYSTLHLLQMGLQTLIDASLRLASTAGWKIPGEYTAIAEVLHRHNVLDAEERELFTRMIRLRNLLIHGYTRIDPQIVYQLVASSAEADLRRIAAAVLAAARTRHEDP